MKKLCTHLHGSQDKKDGKIDLNDHVNIVFSKEPCCEAYDKEKYSWDKHSQEGADDWSAQGDLDNDGSHVQYG